MAYEVESSKQGRDGISLSTEILPVWNIVATCMMLVASILTLLVFTADVGRYVPTGSVLGFEGPSYFYITGLWGLVIVACWGVSTAGKLKRLSISAREDGALLVREHVIGRTRELAIRARDLKAIMIKRYPSAGHVAWLVIAIGWLAFILQFAVPNFQLAFVGFPVAGTTLLVFGGLMAGTAVIGVVRPGFHLVIIDSAATHVIKLPGVLSPRTVLARLCTFVLDAGLVSLNPPGKPDQRDKPCLQQQVLVIGALGILAASIVNIALLLVGNTLPVLNQGSSWAMFVSGCIGIVAFVCRIRTLPENTWVTRDTTTSRVEARPSPRLWLIVIGLTGIVILWYFFGASVRIDTLSPSYDSSNAVWHGILSITFTTWCIIAALETSPSLLVKLGDQYSAVIRKFSLEISQSKKCCSHDIISKSWIALTMVSIFGAISVILFLVGFFRS